ncbi:MAG: hypothetical protein D6712_11655, partial [Chloroflexi bacterium]
YYHVRLTVIDSNGNSQWRAINIFVVDENFSGLDDISGQNPTINHGFENATLTFDAYDKISELPDQTLIAAYYHNPNEPLGDGVVFVGRLAGIQSEQNLTHNAYRATVNGLSNQLSSLNLPPLPMVDSTSPSQWGEIKNLTVARAIHYVLSEHTTLLHVADVDYGSDINSYRIARASIEAGGALASVNKIANTVNRALIFSETGDVAIQPQSWMLSDRSGVPQVCTLDVSDLVATPVISTYNHNPINTVGRVIAYGASYNTTNTSLLAVRATSPAQVPEIGDFNSVLNGQVLPHDLSQSDAFTEIGTRAGNHYTRQQPIDSLSVELLPGYYPLTPSPYWRYVWDIADLLGYDATGWNWQLSSITKYFDQQLGRWIISGEFLRETQGGTYRFLATVPPEAQPEYTNPVMPTMPPYPLLAPDPGVFVPDPDNPDDLDQPIVPPGSPTPNKPPVPGSPTPEQQAVGDIGVGWSSNAVYLIDKISTTNQPITTNITPHQVGSGTIYDVDINPASRHLYVIESDGGSPATSWVYRTNAPGQLGYVRTELSGDYRRVVSAHSADKLYLYGETTGSGTATVDHDFRVSTNGWTITSPAGSWVSGTGFEKLDVSGERTFIEIEINFGTPKTIEYIRMTYSVKWGSTSTVTRCAYIQYWDGSAWQTYEAECFSSGTHDNETISRSMTVTTSKLRVSAEAGALGTGSYARIHDVRFIEQSATALTLASRYSIDDAATFDPPVEVGSTGNVGGASIMPGTTRLLAAGNSIVRDAIDGGAFSDTAGGGSGDPVAIVGYGDGTLEYVYATATNIYKYDGSSSTDITPNDGVNDGVVVGEYCIAMAPGINSHIVAVLDFGGVRKVAYSSDGGATWAFNTQISNSATAVSMKYVTAGIFYVAIVDGAELWISQWDGGTLNLISRNTPALSGFKWI